MKLIFSEIVVADGDCTDFLFTNGQVVHTFTYCFEEFLLLPSRFLTMGRNLKLNEKMLTPLPRGHARIIDVAQFHA